MHWFKELEWSNLALAAVACISVTGVWVTFWPGHRDRLRERRQRRLEHLREINRQLLHIGNWAKSRYDSSSHDPQWYNASWGVNPFEWEDVERFNQVVIAGDYSRALTQALVSLELATQAFHGRLAEQREYLRNAPKDIGLRWPAVVAVAVVKRSAISVEDPTKVSELTDQERAWLGTLYQRNKAIHVEGIGGPGDKGLHEAWRRASDTLVAERVGLQTGRDSRWRWAGHITAGVFAALGLLFLTDFAWSFVGQVRQHEAAVVAPGIMLAPIPGSQTQWL